MGEKVNQYLPYFFGSLILGWLLYFAPQSIGVFGGNDNYAHWTIARYAFYSPDIFLNMWGRPIYNGIMWFPAHYGLEGMKVANTLLFGALALLISDTGRLMGLKYHSWLFVFSLANVLLLKLSMSGKTEILMAFVILLAVHQAIKGRLWAAAIIISLTPFTRPEGWMFFFFFGTYFLFKRKPSRVLGLVVGPLVLALIGWPVFGDFLWYFSQNPYDLKDSVYGSGGPFHFIQDLPNLIGWGSFLFFIGGNLIILTKGKKIRVDWFLLILGPFWAFTAVHSFLWWQGMAGSLGLTRVLGSVMPLASLMAWVFIDRILDLKLSVVNVYVLPLFVVSLSILTLRNFDFPKKEDVEIRYLLKVKEWYDESGLNNRMVYYYNNKMLYFLERNPYSEEAHYFIPKKSFPELVEDEALVMWDSKIAPVEGQFPLEKLMLSEDFEFVQRFVVSDTFREKVGFAPDIYAFIKRNRKSMTSNIELLNDSARTISIETIKDLESP